jgi:hypothetical protein
MAAHVLEHLRQAVGESFEVDMAVRIDKHDDVLLINSWGVNPAVSLVVHPVANLLVNPVVRLAVHPAVNLVVNPAAHLAVHPAANLVVNPVVHQAATSP